ncbi:unnamed protein product, partial [Amoebophrya sp. A25]
QKLSSATSTSTQAAVGVFSNLTFREETERIESETSCPDLVVTTSGKLVEHFYRGSLASRKIVTNLRHFVIDEADRLLSSQMEHPSWLDVLRDIERAKATGIRDFGIDIEVV